MSTGVSVKGNQLIATWTVPLKGTLRSLPAHQIPSDAVYDSSNLITRQGLGQVRPGMTKLSVTALGARPIGAFTSAVVAQAAFQDDAFQADAFQTSVGIPTQALLVATTAKIWVWDGSAYLDITDTPLQASAANLARFTGIVLDDKLVVLHTNGIDAPRKWDGTTPTVSLVAGTPPVFTDWTTADDHVVGIVPPFLVRWSNVLDVGTWPENNFRSLADTPDALVAIRNLGTLGFVVYKTNTIWVGQTTGSTEATLFAFQLRGWFDGPAGPAAVIDARGVHYYMAPSGRIGYFNGTQHDWVAEGVFPSVNAEIDPAYTGRIFGVYEPTHEEVWFYYPRLGDGGDCKGCLLVKLPRPAEGIENHIAFRGAMGIALSTGTDTRNDTREGLLFGASTQLAYRFLGADDDGTAITGYAQTGLVMVPGPNDPHRLEGFEVFAERLAGYGALTVKPVSSYLLDAAGGTLGAAQTVDLTATTGVKDMKGADVKGRFLGLRLEFSTPITLRYKGAQLAARKVE